MVAVKLVYVLPGLSVNPFKFKLVVANVNAVVPKSRVLNHDPEVNVATAVPLPVSVRLGALVAVAGVTLPTEYVRVTAASDTNPPVPVRVRLLAWAMPSTVVPAVGCANTTLPVPKRSLREPVPEELNMPVVNVNPARFNVP